MGRLFIRNLDSGQLSSFEVKSERDVGILTAEGKMKALRDTMDVAVDLNRQLKEVLEGISILMKAISAPQKNDAKIMEEEDWEEDWEDWVDEIDEEEWDEDWEDLAVEDEEDWVKESFGDEEWEEKDSPPT